MKLEGISQISSADCMRCSHSLITSGKNTVGSTFIILSWKHISMRFVSVFFCPLWSYLEASWPDSYSWSGCLHFPSGPPVVESVMHARSTLASLQLTKAPHPLSPLFLSLSCPSSHYALVGISPAFVFIGNCSIRAAMHSGCLFARKRSGGLDVKILPWLSSA